MPKSQRAHKITYIRPHLSPTGPLYYMARGTRRFQPEYVKSGPNKGKEKRSRKRSNKDRMVFVGGPNDGMALPRQDYFWKGNKKVDHFPFFDPRYNRSQRQWGSRKHNGWYLYSDELDVMEWHQPAEK